MHLTTRVYGILLCHERAPMGSAPHMYRCVHAHQTGVGVRLSVSEVSVPTVNVVVCAHGSSVSSCNPPLNSSDLLITKLRVVSKAQQLQTWPDFCWSFNTSVNDGLRLIILLIISKMKSQNYIPLRCDFHHSMHPTNSYSWVLNAVLWDCWGLIPVNFDPIQEIEPKVGG